MSRNYLRPLAAESEIRHRVAREREIRGWSRQRVADEMTAAGCRIDQSAIFKWEAIGRRVSLDEAIALARVFHWSLDDLAPDLRKWSHRELGEYGVLLPPGQWDSPPPRR